MVSSSKAELSTFQSGVNGRLENGCCVVMTTRAVLFFKKISTRVCRAEWKGCARSNTRGSAEFDFRTAFFHALLFEISHCFPKMFEARAQFELSPAIRDFSRLSSSHVFYYRVSESVLFVCLFFYSCNVLDLTEIF